MLRDHFARLCSEVKDRERRRIIYIQRGFQEGLCLVGKALKILLGKLTCTQLIGTYPRLGRDKPCDELNGGHLQREESHRNLAIYRNITRHT